VAAKYTPTQLRFLRMLGDGDEHTIGQLKELLDDDMAGATAVKFHISNLRRKVRACGRDIVFYGNGTPETGTYRMVRLIVGEGDVG